MSEIEEADSDYRGFRSRLRVIGDRSFKRLVRAKLSVVGQDATMVAVEDAVSVR